MSTRIVVAHTQALLAEALVRIFTGTPSIAVSGICRSGGEIVDAIARHRPDVLVTGPMTDVSAAELVEMCRASVSETAVMLVANEHSGVELFQAMEAGVTGYVTVACSAPQLIDAVSRVAAGEVVVLGVEARNRFRAVEQELQREAPGMDELTTREREILKGICAGRSNRQIAAELFISPHTVRTHVQNIRSKLNVNSKLEAAMVMVQGGIERRMPEPAAVPAEPSEPRILRPAIATV